MMEDKAKEEAEVLDQEGSEEEKQDMAGATVSEPVEVESVSEPEPEPEPDADADADAVDDVAPEDTTAATAVADEDESGEDVEPEKEQSNKSQNMKWYVLHTYSGYEKKVRDQLSDRLSSMA